MTLKQNQNKITKVLFLNWDPPNIHSFTHNLP